MAMNASSAQARARLVSLVFVALLLPRTKGQLQVVGCRVTDGHRMTRCAPEGSLAHTRCCDTHGTTCVSLCPFGEHLSFSSAAEQCALMNRRLCLLSEMPTCCDTGCGFSYDFTWALGGFCETTTSHTTTSLTNATISITTIAFVEPPSGTPTDSSDEDQPDDSSSADRESSDSMDIAGFMSKQVGPVPMVAVLGGGAALVIAIVVSVCVYVRVRKQRKSKRSFYSKDPYEATSSCNIISQPLGIDVNRGRTHSQSLPYAAPVLHASQARRV